MLRDGCPPVDRGWGIQGSIDASTVRTSPKVGPAWREVALFVGAVCAMLVPLALASALGRTLDERSLVGFALVLALSLAVPSFWLLAAGEARPMWWVGAGLVALVALQVTDVAALWWRGPPGEGSYAAASSLARLVFLLEILAVAGSGFGSDRVQRGLRGLIARSLPAVALLAVAELAPGRLLSFTYGPSYADAVLVLRLLAPAMLLAGATLAVVQVLLNAGAISWGSLAVLATAVGAPVAAAIGRSPVALAAWMLVVNAVVLSAVALQARRLLVSNRGGGSVLFLAWRDLRHPEGGGSEVYVEEIARRLAAGGRRVTIFCAAREGAPRDEEVAGVRFLRRGGRITVYLWAALYHHRGRFRDHDVVVDVQNGVPFFSPLYCSRRVVVLVHHVHREQWPVVFPERMARFGWWLESRLAPSLYARATYVAVSEATKSELAGLGISPERIQVIHNGTETPAGGGGAGVARSPRPTVAYLGRLVPHKRVEILLEAFAELRERLPGLTLDIAGRGWWEPQLRRRAEELRLGEDVRFLGWVDEAAKAELLARSWVLAMPSIKEGWGLAVLEAASFRTPAVGFRVGGLAESIQDGVTGLVVDDADSFRAALERLLTDADLRGRLGRQAAVWARRFDWDSSARAFDVVFREVESDVEPAPVPITAPA
jgi:glycosyltransferase involved in cell wall biosynthesis